MAQKSLKLTPHPMAARMPRRTPEQREQLRELLIAVGQEVPVVVLGTQIIDGRERYDLLTEMGVAVKTTPYTGDTSEHGIAMAVLSYASGRVMQDHQRAMVGAELLPAFEAMVAERKREVCRAAALKSRNKVPADLPAPLGESRELVAKLLNVSPRSITTAAEILRSDPVLAARVKAEPRFSLNQALAAVRLSAARERVASHKPQTVGAMADFDLRDGDVLERFAALPANSIDCIVTDPPYNIGIDYGRGKKADRLSDTDYLAWCAAWLDESARVLKPGGAIYVMINGLYAGRFDALLRAAGGGQLAWRGIVYWWENNPEYQTGNFADAMRQVHYFVKAGGEPTWNGASWREPSVRNKIGDRRGDPAGRVPDNVFRPDQLFADPRVPGNAIARVPFADAPPQLPLAIPYRLIYVSSAAGDVILDPFNGNGTTGLAALLLSRRYIGFEANRKYAKQSRSWVAHELDRCAKEAINA